MNLSELKNGSTAIILGVVGETKTIKRLVEMGFVKGREIKAIKNAPLKDPVEYELMGYNVTLRRSEALLVEIMASDDQHGCCSHGCASGCMYRKVERAKNCTVNDNIINVALVGNPNCGKTTLYNSLAGRNERTGNYAGVTVGYKTATITHKGYTINLTDLPGVYSVANSVAEEEVVCDVLTNKEYDFIINVVDSTLLERNLYLTTQLMDMGQHVVVALNMFDELKDLGDKYDFVQLSKMMGIPMIPTIASRGVGAIDMLDVIVKRYSREEGHIHIETNMGFHIEDELSKIVDVIVDDTAKKTVPKRYRAMMLLDQNDYFIEKADEEALKLSDKSRINLEREYGQSINQILANARYGYISGALRETYSMNSSNRHPKSTSIDNIMTHRIWGLPIFIAILWFMFFSVFTLGAPLQDLIDMGVSAVADFVDSILSESAIKNLIVDGIIGGVGSVIVFLPNILILFLFIAILEDSGYMARAAFIMDKLMHKIGLHGKSFIPMIMGFGCNVPAIMATRIIEDKKNRLLTMLILPFMSCSARLPVYILLISAFFPEHGSLVLLGVYLSGILIAILSSLLLKKVLFNSPDQPFVMELPPYRVPLFNSVVKHMWSKGSQYLKKMGGVILIGSMLVWALSYYPNQKDSYIKEIGHYIEPAIKPLGFDWKIGVSLISGVVAKEIVIGTMGVLNNSEDGDEHGLALKLQSATNAAGEKIYTPATVISLLAFILIYFPCIAVIAAIRRESGRWRWAIFNMVYTTSLAWIVSFIIYNVLK